VPPRIGEHLDLEEENDMYGSLRGEDPGVGLGLQGHDELGSSLAAQLLPWPSFFHNGPLGTALLGVGRPLLRHQLFF
jgi:hypothetical protein